MATLAFLMNFISDSYGIHVSPEFKVFISDYSSCKLTSDIYTFKFFIIDNELLNEEEKRDVLDLYSVAKMLKNTFQKYIRKRNISKLTPNNNTDLYFNDIDDYPYYQTINIISDDILYRFRLSDMVNMWLKCLNNSENLFVKPIQFKNPYTNLPFKKYNLYNIFIGLTFSKYQVPYLIRQFIKNYCDITTFTLDAYPFLKDNAINDFFETAHTFDYMEQVNNMLHEFRRHIDYVYFPDDLSYRRQRRVVSYLKPILKNYLYGSYGCNPLKKIDAYSKSKEELKDFFKDNPFDTFMLNRRPALPPPPPPEVAINRRRSVFQEPINPSSIAFNLPPPPYNNDDEFVPLSVQEIVNSITTQNDRQISSNSRSIRPYSLQFNGFVPTREIPRTPPNNQNQNNNNNSNNENNNVRPFSLRLF